MSTFLPTIRSATYGDQTVTAGGTLQVPAGDADKIKFSGNGAVGLIVIWKSADWKTKLPGPPTSGTANVMVRYQGNPNPPDTFFVVVIVPVVNTATVTIHAFNDTDADGVQDAGEGNKQGAAVLVQPGNIAGTTDANGNFVFSAVAGTFTLTRTNTPAGYYMSNPTTPGGSSIMFTVKAGESRTVLLGTTNRPIKQAAASVVVAEVGALTSDSWSFFFGVDVYDGKSALPTSGLLKPLGIQGNRVWIDAMPFGAYKTPGELAHAIACWQQTGARPLFMVGGEPVKVATLAGAPAWFMAFVKDAIAKIDAIPALAGQPLEIEVFNETDLATYFDGNAAQYAQAFLAIAKPIKAAYGNRVTICTAGLSWRSADLLIILPIVAGYVDAIGYHGYPTSLADAKAKDAAVLAIAKQFGLPVWYSEFGSGRGGDFKAGKITADAWADEGAARATNAIATAKSLGVPIRLYWYAAINVNNSTNAGESLASIASGKLATTVFYDKLLAALKAAGVR